MQGSSLLQPGSVYEDYQIEGMIGRGENALVFLAKHVHAGTWHAVKILHRIDSRRRLRLQQEGLIREELRHPNIVPVVAYIDVEGDPALVMDHVDGLTFHEWLHQEDPSLLEVLGAFRDIMQGIRHAHHHQVIHRDLKPSNILMERAPNAQWTPRISDFGLAKALAPEVGKFGGLTTVNTGLGTAGYAAPEQVRDASGVTPRADLYAVGCILYESVCGVAPFGGMSTFDTLAAQKDERFTPPEHIAPGLPPTLYALLRSLLSADPNARPADCDAVLAKLTAVQAEVDAMMAPPVEDESWVPGQHGVMYAAAFSAVPLVALAVGSMVVFWAT